MIFLIDDGQLRYEAETEFAFQPDAQGISACVLTFGKCLFCHSNVGVVAFQWLSLAAFPVDSYLQFGMVSGVSVRISHERPTL